MLQKLKLNFTDYILSYQSPLSNETFTTNSSGLILVSFSNIHTPYFSETDLIHSVSPEVFLRNSCLDGCCSS